MNSKISDRMSKVGMTAGKSIMAACLVLFIPDLAFIPGLFQRQPPALMLKRYSYEFVYTKV
jgi:hypothetical protein